MAILFWTERLAMLGLFCIWVSGTIEGLVVTLTVLVFIFSNILYLNLFLDEMESKVYQKREEKVICDVGSQNKGGGGNGSVLEEEKKGKDKRTGSERTCSTIASDNGKDSTKSKEDGRSEEELLMKLGCEERNKLKINFDEAAGKKNEVEASRNKYEEDYWKKLKEKIEKWAKELKQAAEKYEEDCGKWEEERCSIAAKLYDETATTQVYQRLLQYSEENGRKLEEEKNSLTEQLCAVTAQSELYRSILSDPCYQ